MYPQTAKYMLFQRYMKHIQKLIKWYTINQASTNFKESIFYRACSVFKNTPNTIRKKITKIHSDKIEKSLLHNSEVKKIKIKSRKYWVSKNNNYPTYHQHVCAWQQSIKLCEAKTKRIAKSSRWICFQSWRLQNPCLRNGRFQQLQSQ